MKYSGPARRAVTKWDSEAAERRRDLCTAYVPTLFVSACGQASRTNFASFIPRYIPSEATIGRFRIAYLIIFGLRFILRSLYPSLI
ncbi:hypothetical protein ASPVEDRAFT_295424 [Aspergillus versicolor CBS 583.65]|uniref:Uncharacterized protein n=1 Tax=Aspergillus versicolor CBS 583.65 TaxID=1036611 RepID=A0A1L9P7L1_ASPVE|nr:uncharacterized protein ASPVEDRAFT_295424 [Aspergillus versicolor CBS 583.65]OJI97498.1 hypothetical protein ASPVEDRAFT_295424 [Aspergillus versicolor CBS 583.65]